MTNKKKQQPSKWFTSLLITLLCSGLLIVSYSMAKVFLPESFFYAGYGPTFMSRSFSPLAIVYNVLFAAVIAISGYFGYQLYNEKHLAALKKRNAKNHNRVTVETGANQYNRRKVLGQGISIMLVMVCVGTMGTMTSESSNAQNAPKIKTTTFSKLANTPSGLKKANGKVIDTMEGGTTDGKYIYIAFENPTGGGYIAKYDLKGKLIKTSARFTPAQIGHANGMTYDKVRNRLVLAVYRAEGKKILNGSKVIHIHPDTLKITISRNVSPEANVTNICYNAATNQYVSNGKLYDANLKLIRKNVYNYGKYLKMYGDKNTAGQGIACNASNIYVMRYYPDKTKPHNHIYIYDWSGKLVSVYNVKGLMHEANNIFILNNQLYMGVNNGFTYQGKKSDNKNDFIIRLNDIPVTRDMTTPSGTLSN